jgi:hypothetical protein
MEGSAPADVSDLERVLQRVFTNRGALLAGAVGTALALSGLLLEVLPFESFGENEWYARALLICFIGFLFAILPFFVFPERWLRCDMRLWWCAVFFFGALILVPVVRDAIHPVPYASIDVSVNPQGAISINEDGSGVLDVFFIVTNSAHVETQVEFPSRDGVDFEPFRFAFSDGTYPVRARFIIPKPPMPVERYVGYRPQAVAVLEFIYWPYSPPGGGCHPKKRVVSLTFAGDRVSLMDVSPPIRIERWGCIKRVGQETHSPALSEGV